MTSVTRPRFSLNCTTKRWSRISHLFEWVNSGQNRQTETAAKQLFQVIKDHNTEAVQEMLDVSNVYCYQEAGASSDSPDSDDEDICPRHFPTVPCLTIVVNQLEHCATIQRAIERLRSDGLVVDIDVLHDDSSFLHSNEIGSNEVSAVIKKTGATTPSIDHRCTQNQRVHNSHT